MNGIRPPVAAGSFYPARPDELAALVDRLLAAAAPPRPVGGLRALVVPHAGYAYSGAVAAAAFAVIPAGSLGLRVALLGPSHFVPLRRAAVTGALAWRTPLGTVSVDEELRAAAVGAGAAVDDEPHALDHALEVELPFLQRLAGGGLRVLPVAVGAADEAVAVAAAVGNALIVVSSDLSHYHDDATARRLDRRTAQAVLALDDAALGDRDACGVDALRGLLRHAGRTGWSCSLLDLRTSADAAGDRRRCRLRRLRVLRRPDTDAGEGMPPAGVGRFSVVRRTAYRHAFRWPPRRKRRGSAATGGLGGRRSAGRWRRRSNHLWRRRTCWSRWRHSSAISARARMGCARGRRHDVSSPTARTSSRGAAAPTGPRRSRDS